MGIELVQIFSSRAAETRIGRLCSAHPAASQSKRRELNCFDCLRSRFQILMQIRSVAAFQNRICSPVMGCSKPNSAGVQGQTGCAAFVGARAAAKRVCGRFARRRPDGPVPKDGCGFGAFGRFASGIRAACICRRPVAPAGERASPAGLPTSGCVALPRWPSPRSRTRFVEIVCALTVAFDDRQIPAMRRVVAELFGQMALGLGGEGKHHQPARFTVQAMHGPNRHGHALPRRRGSSLATMRESISSSVGCICRRCCRPIPLFAMPIRRQARRLFDHHHLLVEMHDLHILFARRRSGRLRQDFH